MSECPIPKRCDYSEAGRFARWWRATWSPQVTKCQAFDLMTHDLRQACMGALVSGTTREELVALLHFTYGQVASDYAHHVAREALNAAGETAAEEGS